MKSEVQMSMRRRGDRRGQQGAFTLIEVLTVISLLSVLLLATLPAFRSARTSAQRHTAASEAMEIAGAALAFRHVYGSWPCEEEAQGSGTVLTAGKTNASSRADGRMRQDGETGTGFASYDLDIGKVVHVLIGDDDAEYRVYNPRALQFLELSRSCLSQREGDSHAYPYDPWGQPYVLVMSRAVQQPGSLSEKVSRIEGGLVFRNARGGTPCYFETPDDAAAFSWGDPTMITNAMAPTRIVGSWSTR